MTKGLLTKAINSSPQSKRIGFGIGLLIGLLVLIFWLGYSAGPAGRRTAGIRQEAYNLPRLRPNHLEAYDRQTQVEKPADLLIEYYYYSPCEPCQEGEVFAQQFRFDHADQLAGRTVAILYHNVSDLQLEEEFRARTASQETAHFTPHVPALKIGEYWLFGITSITNQAGFLLEGTEQSKQTAATFIQPSS